MIGRHDKPVFVFSKHVTLQHPQHCGSCAFEDCHACKECGADREREDWVLWRERDRCPFGENGIKIGNDGAEDPVAQRSASDGIGMGKRRMSRSGAIWREYGLAVVAADRLELGPAVRAADPPSLQLASQYWRRSRRIWVAF